MLKHYFISISLTILVLSFHAARASRNNERQKNTNIKGKFDQFALAQIWPQTSCWNLNYKQSKLVRNYNCNPCKHPLRNNDWTLHGLWPSSLTGPHPFFCNKSVPFNFNLLSENLKFDMNRHWPTYKLNFSDRNFWKHEWSKHGTCALQLEHTNSQAKYFAKALELLHRYNIGNALEQLGVIPGHEYKLDTINQAINKALRVNVFVECARLPETEKQYIVQVLTCFDKDFNLVNCHNSNSSNCKKKENIVYPNILKSC